MPYITEIYSRELLDSKGCPTIETEVFLESGSYGRAIVSSDGLLKTNDNCFLRDCDKKEYFGFGVSKAVANVNKVIAPALIGEDARDQIKVDYKMLKLDGTDNKTKLGANAMLSVSLAVLRAAADYSALPLYQYLGGIHSNILPYPFVTILYLESLDIKDYMIVPVGANNMKNALMMISEINYALNQLIVNTTIKSTEDALNLIKKSIEKANYKLKDDIVIALGVNADNFFDKKQNKYLIDSATKSNEELVDYYLSLTNIYPIVLFMNAMQHNDVQGYKKLTHKVGSKAMISCSFYSANMKQLEKAIKNRYMNAISVNPIQLGTVSETLELIDYAKKEGIQVVVESKNNETEDTFISDLSVATLVGKIKLGRLIDLSTTSKLNQLVRVEESLGSIAKFQ